ncbi:MAG: adenylate/guanylate cyclase domain-containing protein [Roseiarcus sp.]
MSCPVCAFENPTNARFCGGCGVALAAPANAWPEAERRHICLLFCDLVGSTPMSQQLDAEDLRTALGSYQHACKVVVNEIGGFIAQYKGDNIEVYFGYPVAHEDDASRAVQCGLEMVEAVRKLADSTKFDLRVRVGIHNGRVVVGSLGGPDRSERWAIGDTPNIAARIQAEASPGEVVVSDALQRLLNNAFVVESMGFRTLKGVDRRVEIFRVIGRSGLATVPNALQTPFLGRVRARQQFREFWTRCKAAVPQFMLLRGDPGIGKSRFVEEVRSEIFDDGTDVLVARCAPIAANTAFHPILELISLRLGFASAAPEVRVASIARRMEELGFVPTETVPLIASLFSLPLDPAKWSAPNLTPAVARRLTMDIFIDWIHAITRYSLVLLIIEDLHWADPSTIELLDHLIRSRRSARLMILSTARPEFKPTWASAANVTLIELEALDAEEVEILIRRVASDKALPPTVVWQIRERGSGNPLFLEEITRTVLESGSVVARENSWEIVATMADAEVPVSMQASLVARIDRLGEARALFQLGAAIGREFSPDLLTAVAQLPEETVRRQLDAMVESGLLVRLTGPSPVYAFKHALIRDAAYDLLLKATRRKYHGRIAKMLIDRFPESVENLPELLAHHLSGAGDYLEAAARWQAAGARATQRGAVKEAVSHLRRALADLGQLSEDPIRLNRELEVLTALAPVLSAVAGWGAPVVGETCSRAIELARRLGADDRIYALMWVLWSNQFVGGRLRDAPETAAKLFTMGLDANDPMLVTIGRGATCYTHYYRGEYDAVIAMAGAGLRVHTSDMDSIVTRKFQISPKSTMLITKASALWMQGRQDDGIATANELIAHGRGLGHPPSVATTLGTAMYFNLYDRDWKRLFALAEEVHELARAEGFAMWTAVSGLYRGRARMGLGEVEAGVAEVLEWGALFHQTGCSGVLEGSFTSMMGEAMHLAGRSEEALVESNEGERRAKAGCVLAMMPEIYRIRGNILRNLDRLDQADEAYREAVDCARAQGARSLELRALTSQLDLRLALGQPEDIPTELHRAMNAMICAPDRPDLAAARELLMRLGGEAILTREPAEGRFTT